MSQGKYYAANEDFEAELQRLRIQESYYDAVTFRHLETLGVKDGWNCLEIGAGTGSVAEWLAKQVAPDGKVVATDINPRFLGLLNVPHLEIRQHNILLDPLEIDFYSLVHCRAVLQHLAEPEKALERMAKALRPGGWLLIEEVDYGSGLSTDITNPAAAVFTRTTRLMSEGLRRNKIADPYFGRRVRELLEKLGFEGVNNEGVSQLTRGGDATAQVGARNIQIASKQLIAAGLITQTEADEAHHLLLDPSFYYIGSTLYAAWGKKPAVTGL